ncbi:MAG TPA: segregation and condensation protein A [Firmicutes bacterium]|nr:segregation and condensation protein A [Bacillota bacterium]
MHYQVKLDKFEGPLDLLLYLIKKQEINIYDIPIARITQQYLEYLKLMEFLNLELAGEFLVMAATLMRIKARMLLPRHEDEEEEGEDPRQQLVQQLLEYQKFKSAASKLEAMEYQRRMLFPRPEQNGKSIAEDEYSYNLFDLITAFKAVLERNRVTYLEVEVEETSVEEKIDFLKQKLSDCDMIAFEDLFEGQQSLVELIVTFLALLEVLRLRIATVRQTRPFGKIWIKAVKGS